MEDTPRPGAPRVLGILSIVFGAVVTAFSLFSLAASGISADFASTQAMKRAMAEYTAALQPWSTVIVLVMIAMSIALIFIGIGQRGYRRWTRSASVAWSSVALVVLAGQFAFHFLVTAPALDAMLKGMGAGKLGASMAGFGTGVGVLSLVLYAPYPIILLVMMRKPSAVAAMQA